jgi:hypothetical protein
VTLADFHAYLPDHSYIFAPTGAFWSMPGVNAALRPVPVRDKNGKPVLDKNGKEKTVPATVWLDRFQPVHHLTWAPGHPMLIRDRLIVDGGWVVRKKVTTFNLYRPPTLKHGDRKKAGPWLELVRKVYPNEAQRIIRFAAHRVQKPEQKINHGLVLGGAPGIGKDSIWEPVKRAVGAWNFSEASPQQVLGRFNGFLKAVICRVSEVRDLGEFNRFQFYEHMKAYLAAPPDTLRVDEKHVPAHGVLNCVAVVFTTNHLSDGIYLPGDDRRHDVMWSDLTQEDFEPGYWKKIWDWYDSGGDAHVAAYLATLDISKFDPKAPPPKTEAFFTIVDANRAPEEGELEDVLDGLGNPDAVTLADIVGALDHTGDFQRWLTDRKNRRIIPHRFESVNYVPVRNDARKTGLWVVGGVRSVVYAKKSLTPNERLKAVGALQRETDKKAAEAEKARKKKANGPTRSVRI